MNNKPIQYGFIPKKTEVEKNIEKAVNSTVEVKKTTKKNTNTKSK